MTQGAGQEAPQEAPLGRSCPYLPEQTARLVGFEWIEQGRLNPQDYEHLMGANFRRSGLLLYQPRCPSCSACKAIRVLTLRFAPTRSMRRVARRNAEIRVTVGEPKPTPEKHRIYADYLAHQHDGTMDPSFESFERFLYRSPTRTLEFEYRCGKRILAVTLADRVIQGISSVYAYFDPAFADRSLGTFSALWEIDYCRREGLPYYYLGYFVEGCASMEYKARFRPNEILVAPWQWAPFRN